MAVSGWSVLTFSAAAAGVGREGPAWCQAPGSVLHVRGQSSAFHASVTRQQDEPRGAVIASGRNRNSLHPHGCGSPERLAAPPCGPALAPQRRREVVRPGSWTLGLCPSLTRASWEPSVAPGHVPCEADSLSLVVKIPSDLFPSCDRRGTGV